MVRQHLQLIHKVWGDHNLDPFGCPYSERLATKLKKTQKRMYESTILSLLTRRYPSWRRFTESYSHLVFLLPAGELCGENNGVDELEAENPVTDRTRKMTPNALSRVKDMDQGREIILFEIRFWSRLNSKTAKRKVVHSLINI